jgi:hypothetical protein
MFWRQFVTQRPTPTQKVPQSVLAAFQWAPSFRQMASRFELSVLGSVGSTVVVVQAPPRMQLPLRQMVSATVQSASSMHGPGGSTPPAPPEPTVPPEPIVPPLLSEHPTATRARAKKINPNAFILFLQTINTRLTAVVVVVVVGAR